MPWLSLPMPPPANSLYANRKEGGRFKTARYSDWIKQAAWAVRAERGERINGGYALYLQAGRPDRRKRDLDNLLKPISDALVRGGAVRDDAYCERIDARWCPDVVGIRVLVLPTKSPAADAPQSASASL